MPVWGTGPRRTDGRTNNPINAPLTYILPNEIPSLGLWLDSTDLSTFVLSSISTVRIWRDKSQFGLNFSTQQGLPQLNLGSGAGVLFNTARTDLMLSFSSITVSNGNTTIFAVCVPSGGMMIGLNGGTIDCALRFNNGSTNANDIFFQSISYLNGSVVPWFASQANVSIIDGIASNTGYLGVSLIAPISLSGSYLGRYYGGTINEVLFFNSALDSTQRRGIEAYLARKWGVQSRLPFQHPGRPSQALAGYRFLNYQTNQAVSNIAMWYDAMFTESITDTGNNTPPSLPPNTFPVSSWRDRSGNNNTLTQAGSPLGPSFKYVGCNYYPNINSVSNYGSPFISLARATLTNQYVGCNISMFAVISFATTTTTTLVFGNDCVLSYNNNAVRFYRDTNGPVGTPNNFILSAPLASNTQALVSILVNGSTTTVGNVLPSTNVIELNGSLVNTSTLAGSNFNTTGVSFFSAYGSQQGNNGGVTISEILFFYRTLTTPERTAIESQLIRKWQLPSNAPITYINSLPVTSGLFGWYDAYDETTVLRNSINNVSMWLDKSGQSNHMSTNLLQFGSNTGSNIYYSSIQISTNQYPSLFFPSTFAFLQTSTLITNQNISSLTMMAVKRGIKIPVSQNRTVSLFSTLGNFELGGGYIGATYNAINNQNINNTQLLTNYSTFHINTLIANIGTATSNGVLASNAVVYYNGGNAATTTGITYNGNIYPSYVRLMASAFSDQANGDSRADAGYLAEVLLFNRVLSSTELTNTHNYLLNKWGISNIISNVPVTSGLNLWLDAYDPATVLLSTNTNLVQRWRDKSGCNYHFSNTITTATLFSPSYITNPNNNLPGLLFTSDMVTTRTTMYNTNFNINTRSEATLFSVFQQRANPNNVGYIFVSGLTVNDNDFLSGNGFTLRTGGNTGIALARSSFSAQINSVNINVPTLASCVFNSSFSTTLIADIPQNRMALGRNGMIGATNISSGISTLNDNFSSIAFNIGGAVLGARNPASADRTTFYDGYIHETLLYNRTLTFAERQQVESYLMSKWNI